MPAGAARITTLLLVAVLFATIVVRRSGAAVDRRLLGWLVASASIGVPIGVWFVARVDAEALRTGLGALLVGYAIASLLPLPSPRPLPRSDAVVGAFGLLAGALGGALNLMGPPVVVLMQLQRLDPATFRATLHAFALLVNVVVVLVWCVSGDEPGRAFEAYAIVVLPVLLAARIGHRAFARLDARRFRPMVHVLIGLAGARLLVPG